MPQKTNKISIFNFNNTIRVYYEDTDSGGVVYHANYLKYAERSRTEMLRKYKIEQEKLKTDFNIQFIVKNLFIECNGSLRQCVIVVFVVIGTMVIRRAAVPRGHPGVPDISSWHSFFRAISSSRLALSLWHLPSGPPPVQSDLVVWKSCE